MFDKTDTTLVISDGTSARSIMAEVDGCPDEPRKAVAIQE